MKSDLLTFARHVLRWNYHKRLAQLKVNETPASDLEQNLIDFENNRLVFNRHDLNIVRVSSMDFYEKRSGKDNRFGEYIEALIKTQGEEFGSRFIKRPRAFKGFMLTDRDNDAHPVGQIYHRKHRLSPKLDYLIQPIYVLTHPDYRRQGFSKVLRLTLLYDLLVRSPSIGKCKEIAVIPYEETKERVVPFFRKLDPDLRNTGLAESNEDLYCLNPQTVKQNLYKQFKEMKIDVVG